MLLKSTAPGAQRISALTFLSGSAAMDRGRTEHQLVVLVAAGVPALQGSLIPRTAPSCRSSPC